MTDPKKIEAAIVTLGGLSAHAELLIVLVPHDPDWPSIRVDLTLTVADFRELLVQDRDRAWFDVRDCLPERDQEVEVEHYGYDRAASPGYYWSETNEWTDNEGCPLYDVRRWRELSR